MENMHTLKVQLKLIQIKVEINQRKLMHGKTEINTEFNSNSGLEKHV